MMDSFSEMSFLNTSSKIKSDTGYHAPQSVGELVEVYTSYLSNILGDFSSVKVEFLNLANEDDREHYAEILNDPQITPISKEGQFSSSEYRDRDTYSKDSCYDLLIVYRENDYNKAFEKMTEYVSKLRNVRPKITNPGGIYELLQAWEMFVKTIPVSKRAKASDVTAVLHDFLEEIKTEARKTAIDIEAERAAARMQYRTLSDDISNPHPEPDPETIPDVKLSDVAGGEQIGEPLVSAVTRAAAKAVSDKLKKEEKTAAKPVQPKSEVAKNDKQ